MSSTLSSYPQIRYFLSSLSFGRFVGYCDQDMEGYVANKFSAWKRVEQRGVSAAKAMLIETLDFKRGDGDIVVIVDAIPNLRAEFGRAVLEMFRDSPQLHYMGWARSDEHLQTIKSDFLGTLMRWWDSSSEAGSQSRPTSSDDVTRPTLNVVSFDGNRPVIPTSSYVKFVEATCLR